MLTWNTTKLGFTKVQRIVTIKLLLIAKLPYYCQQSIHVRKLKLIAAINGYNVYSINYAGLNPDSLEHRQIYSYNTNFIIILRIVTIRYFFNK